MHVYTTKTIIVINQGTGSHIMKIMTNSCRAALLTFAIFASQQSFANETIYTWTEEQNSLTNFGGIPPDDETGNQTVKVVDIQKGVTTQFDFPTRDIDAAVERNRELKLLSPPGSTAPAPSNSNATTSTTKMIGSSTPPANTNTNTNNTAPEVTSNKPQVLASGGNTQLVVDPLEEEKLNEQEVKLEQQAKSARRIAMDKRREEMKSLAERVRNGAATRQEIAALVTNRQTASFGESRSALARPKAAKKVTLSD